MSLAQWASDALRGPALVYLAEREYLTELVVASVSGSQLETVKSSAYPVMLAAEVHVALYVDVGLALIFFSL